jgi:hypothetical protein
MEPVSATVPYVPYERMPVEKIAMFLEELVAKPSV